MKKILFLLVPNFAIAQSYIAPSFTFAKTSIYNKEDVISDLLPSTASSAPAYALNFGKTKNSVFYEIGIGYIPISQNYKGWYFYLNDANNVATATKKLTYLQIPLLIGKSFMQNKKIQLYLQGGINLNYLLNYSTNYHADYSTNGQNQPPNAFVNYTQSGNNISMNHDNGILYANYISSEWYFRKFVFGLTFNLGLDYKLNSKIALRISSNNYISLTNPENNKPMDFGIDKGNGDPLFMGVKSNFNPYDRYQTIISGRNGVSKRGPSMLLSNGISISLKYFLNN
jgi:Outer membrane protein beta-barrel domain